MASGKFIDFAQDMLNHFFRTTTSNSPTTCQVSLHGVNTTSSVLGTEVANGGGYTNGGQVPTFDAPSAADPSVMTSGALLEWTNSSGGNWDVDSLVVHNGGAAVINSIDTDNCRLYINGLGLTIPDTATITVAIGDLTVSQAL